MIGIRRIGSIVAPIIAGYVLDAGFTASRLYRNFGVDIAIGGVLVYLLHRAYRGHEDADATLATAAAH